MHSSSPVSRSYLHRLGLGCFLSAALFVGAVLLSCLTGFAQGTSGKGSLTGTVTDNSGAVIQGARIQLTPKNFMTVSDSLGEFVVPSLNAGEYALTVTSAGFNDYNAAVTITSEHTAKLNVILQVASKGVEVVVSGASAHTEVEAINQQLAADNILQVMPSEQIFSLPNANVADAVGRFPGVTLQRTEGEGQYVQIRGLDPRLSNVTIDGVTVPSPESSVRQVNLTTIPANLVQSLEINKTLSANQDADGIGGSVNLVTKSAGNTPTMSFGSTIGHTPIANGRYIGQVDGTIGRRFGASKRWGAVLGGSADYNGRAIDNLQPTPNVNPDGSDRPYFDNATIRQYRYYRDRWGVAGGMDYRLKEGSSLSLHGLFSDFKDWGDKYYYQVTTLGSPKFYESSKRPTYGIGSLSLSGHHLFSSSWITWGAAVSRSRQLNSGGNPKVTFNAVSSLKTFGTKNCSFDSTAQTNLYRPQWASACMIPSSPLYQPENYTMNQLVTTKGQSVQLNLQGWASMAINYRIGGGHLGTLEYGVMVRNAHKFQNAYTPTYTAASGISLAPFIGGFVNRHYYGGSYHPGPFADYNLIRAYFDANPAKFTLDNSTTHLNSDPNNFNLIERVSAGYVMNTADFGRLRLQAGLRVEGTQLNTLGYVAHENAKGAWTSTDSTTHDTSYLTLLPSVQAKYRVTVNGSMRGVYARGISRPNPYDLVPYALANEDNTPPLLSTGNPNLKPTTANSFDLLYEYMIRPFGLVQAGYFYKSLTDPIFLAQTPVSSGSFSGYLQSQMTNAADAHVSGLEFAWQQRFTFLPGAFGGTGITANYAYINSKVEGLPNRTDSPMLNGAARHSFNLNPYYERGRVSMHTSLSYNGANIYAYQYINKPATGGSVTKGGIHGPLSDNYFYPHLQIDAQVGVRIVSGLKLLVNGLNLNNEVFGFYNGSTRYMTQREYYKPTYSAQLRWEWGER